MSEDDAVLLETASIPAYNFRMSTCVHKCAQRDRYCPEKNVSFRDKSAEAADTCSM